MALFFFLLFLFLPRLLFLPTLSLNQEGLYLHHAKLRLYDPSGSLSSWNIQDATPCAWLGVHCDSGSVTSVDLSNANISGTFPNTFCRLSNLTFLSLYNNFINDTLPLRISACQSLAQLDLAQNMFTGALPESLADLPNLFYLDLSYNSFSGDVPAGFGRFPRLEVLSLVSNLLDGVLAPELGNVSTLRVLNISYNLFRPSQIPAELGNLTSLKILWLTQCNLVGRIPDSLGKLRSLIDLDLASNYLEGHIPRSLTGLTSVVQIELFNNSLTGMIPSRMSNLTNLRFFDASMNRLGGQIPDELCNLPLKSLQLYQNQFVGSLPESLAKSPNLVELRLFENRLTGELPRDLGENSPLFFIDVSMNMFTGAIPRSLCVKGALTELLVIHNSFSGSIPANLGDCYSLERIRLGHNGFSGDVPANFWGLPRVYFIDLVSNFFTGQISSNIRSASNLSSLLLSNNTFTGSIPDEIGQASNLIDFSGNDNHFTGPLPASIVNLAALEKLDLRSNRLSGGFPAGVHLLKKLYDLNLANNDLSGNIPQELGSLASLNYLDLSQNKIYGRIPPQLQNLKLNQLNLSNNRLSGDIPPIFTQSMYRSSFMGNPGLCGVFEGRCVAGGDEAKSKNYYIWMLKSILVLALIGFVVGVVCYYKKYRNLKMVRTDIDRSKWTLISFHKLDFSEYEILDCLEDEDNVIGSGVSGKVYKAVLSNGEAVAVKKLWGGSKLSDSGSDCLIKNDGGFETEVKMLGKIRHRNIVRLWCCCTSKECKLLVYEYMPNGSLGDLLHSSKGGLLDWKIRYKIAVEAAEGLSYLHHDCVPPIVHRDVKSNNILLDGNFGARVADFGVAKVVDLTSKGPKSSSLVVGSCGYIAPEYAYTVRINEKSDIYSFGVVLLELVTGRRPNDPSLGDQDLVRWTSTTLDRKGADHVLDPKLRLDERDRDEICRLLNVGLACASPLPINRPSMRWVAKMLAQSEGRRIIVGKGDAVLSPYYYEDGSDTATE